MAINIAHAHLTETIYERTRQNKNSWCCILVSLISQASQQRSLYINIITALCAQYRVLASRMQTQNFITDEVRSRIPRQG